VYTVRVIRPVTALCLLLLAPADARAHQSSVVRLEIQPRGREVVLQVRGSRHDLSPALGVAAGVNPLARLYLAKRQQVTKAVAGYITVTSARGARPCAVRDRALEADEEQVTVRLTYRCPRLPDPLTLRYDLFFDQDPTHRVLVTVEGSGRGTLDRRHRVFTLDVASVWDNARDFVVLGVEHIFTGYDHILFLVGLLLAAGLVGGGLRPGLSYLLAVVTSFTVAHSITLICAALGWIALGSRVVEPAIAATIIYVGVENIVVQAPRRRWMLTFLFGLVHGFGFAHILSEVGLPQRGLVLSLLGFNLGVELGQVTLVAVLFPVVHLLSRQQGGVVLVALAGLVGLFLGLLRLVGVVLPWWLMIAIVVLVGLAWIGARRVGYRRAVLQAGSALIALFGLLWLVERVLGVTLLGGHLG